MEHLAPTVVSATVVLTDIEVEADRPLINTDNVVVMLFQINLY